MTDVLTFVKIFMGMLALDWLSFFAYNKGFNRRFEKMDEYYAFAFGLTLGQLIAAAIGSFVGALLVFIWIVTGAFEGKEKLISAIVVIVWVVTPAFVSVRIDKYLSERDYR